MFLRNAWYVAAWSDELTHKPIARRICNDPIVLYREQDGTAAALFDSCCHRGAPLSLGTVIDAGLQCGYHGLVFASDGRCVRIPGQTAAIPNKVRVKSFRVIERNQLVWIWMGESSDADLEMIVAYPYHDDSVRWPHRHDVYHVRANYVMLTDNLMDLTHLGFVHGSTVGGDPTTHVEAKMETVATPRGVRVTRWMPDSVPPPTYQRSVQFAGNVDRWQDFEYVAPSAVLQWTGAVAAGTGASDPAKREGGFSLRLFHGITPETESTSHYFWSAANGYRQTEAEATEDLYREIAEAFTEDKAIVEAQQLRVAEVGEDACIDIRSDVARVAMRRTLYRLMNSVGSSRADA
jgi:phenylpropionate dioxygenase-like ring-hydroxylating dioxygenase large terminal subunit